MSRLNSMRVFVCTALLLVSGQVNAALIDATTINFAASGSPNSIGGGWSSGNITVGDSQNIEFFTVEIIDLFSSFGPISSISIEGGGSSIAFCNNPVSCISGASTNNLVTVDSSATESSDPWDFLLSLAGIPIQINRGQTHISYSSGGGSASASGSILVQAFDSSVPIPEPETYALMLTGLGIMGWVRKRKNKQTVEA